MHRESTALRTSPSWFLGSGCVDCSPRCSILSDKFDKYNCSGWFDHIVLALVLLSVHFLCQENVLRCQCCLLCSLLGTYWWNMLCHLRRAQRCCSSWETGLLEGCWDRLTTSAKSCSPSHRHSSVPGILQPGFWCQVPQVSMLEPHKALVFLLALLCIQSHCSAKPRTSNIGFYFLSYSLGRVLHICKIPSCFLQPVCKGCLQAAQWIQWGVWHWASFPFICPVGPTRVWWCSCLGNARFPLQLTFCLRCFYDGSNLRQRIALSSPSHRKK